MSWRNEKEAMGKEIIHALYEKGMIKTWFRDNSEGWKLISGIWSPFYIQLRPLSSDPTVLKMVGHALGKMIKRDMKDINRIVGVAMAGIPIATSISITEDIPSAYTRKIEGPRTLKDFRRLIREYGEHSLIEGELSDGDNIAIVDDLVTKFDSKLIAIEQVKNEIKKRNLKNIKCNNVVVLLDREQGAAKTAEEYGITLSSIIPFKSKGLKWLKSKFSSYEYEVISDYLNNPNKYQDLSLQKEVIKAA